MSRHPPLNQTEKDLNRFAQEKAYYYIQDVVQSFDIAGVNRTQALACLGSTMLRLAATMALCTGADREHWLRYCNEVFEQAQEAKENDDDDED
jgi:hypothetical protein